MTKVEITSADDILKVRFVYAIEENMCYSHMLFDQFSAMLDNFINSDGKGTYSFRSTVDDERRILELLDDLTKQNNDIEVVHDSVISKNIQNYRREREEFEVFSQKARNIRDNKEHSFEELNDFEESLSTLKEGLFWHQKLSAYHLAFSKNACNFSVPGSGKTRVVYSAYNYLKHKGEIEGLFVIGPLSSAIAWEEEYQSVFGRQPDIFFLNGSTPDYRLNRIYGSKPPEVSHVSYNSLPKFFEHIKYINTKRRMMMVVDEAHRIKNPEGYWSSTLLRLVEDIDTAPVSRVILTGTPAPNTYVDLNNLFKFIWPKNEIIGYSIKALKQMSTNPTLPSNRKKIDILIDSIAPYYIRIKKSDLGLPSPIINPPLISTPDELQRDIYTYIRDDLIGVIKRKNKNASYGLRLIRLRQAASNPSLLMGPVDVEYYASSLDENEDYLEPIHHLIAEYNTNRISSKFIDTIALIKSLIKQGRKVLLWCEFIGSVEKLSDLLAHEGIKYDLLTGLNNDYEVRKRVVDDFNSQTGDLQVVVATPLAVGESISLHKACHDAIYFEISYNAGLHLQSMDRIHRLGLHKDVETNYWYIQSDFPIEKNILERVREKETKMRKIIESKDIPLISDYRDLFDNPYEQVDLRDLMKMLNG